MCSFQQGICYFLAFKQSQTFSTAEHPPIVLVGSRLHQTRDVLKWKDAEQGRMHRVLGSLPRPSVNHCGGQKGPGVRFPLKRGIHHSKNRHEAWLTKVVLSCLKFRMFNGLKNRIPLRAKRAKMHRSPHPTRSRSRSSRLLLGMPTTECGCGDKTEQNARDRQQLGWVCGAYNTTPFRQPCKRNQVEYTASQYSRFAPDPSQRPILCVPETCSFEQIFFLHVLDQLNPINRDPRAKSLEKLKYLREHSF